MMTFLRLAHHPLVHHHERKAITTAITSSSSSSSLPFSSWRGARMMLLLPPRYALRTGQSSSLSNRWASTSSLSSLSVSSSSSPLSISKSYNQTHVSSQIAPPVYHGRSTKSSSGSVGLLFRQMGTGSMNKRTAGHERFATLSILSSGAKSPLLLASSSSSSSSFSSLNKLPMMNPLSLHVGSIQHLSSWPPRQGGEGEPHPSPGGGGGGRGPPRSRIASGLGVLGTSALVLAGKGKYLLGVLKLTKFASLGSMLFTVGTYSVFFGLPYAAGMVGLILVHESGHALMMRHLGIPFSPMVFVPFVGAAVAMKRKPRDAYDEALVAFGGPALGSAGALGVALVAHGTDSQLLYALADFGFMINLFNMLPIGMMDGGRICGALSPYAGVLGLGIGGSLIYTGFISNPIFYLIMLAGGYETFMKFYRPENIPLNYYKITPQQRTAIAAGYFGLVGVLFAAMAVNEEFKKPPEVLERERERARRLGY